MNWVLIGSLAIILLLIWSMLTCLLAFIYKYCRRYLYKLNPASAGNLLLLLLALPLLAAFLCTVLLSVPAAESRLISGHCHSTCEAHIPLVKSSVMIGLGLTIATVAALFFFWIWRKHQRAIKNIHLQLRQLGGKKLVGNLIQIPVAMPLVFTVGWWRLTIYISQGLKAHCSKQELGIIIAHEQAHYDRKDNLRVLCASLVTVMQTHMLLKPLFQDLQLFTEAACDFQATKQFCVLDVAETIIKVRRLMPEMGSLPDGISGINGSIIERRVNLLLDKEKLIEIPSSCIALIPLLLIAAVPLTINPLHRLLEWIF